MAFKKSFFLAILIAFLNIQFVLAMDKEDEELGWSISNLLNNANKRLGQAADLMDVVNGAGPPESVLPIQQSTTPFFEELPDDIALCVFSQLCKTEQPLQELRAVALTCRKGHHLTQDPSLWEPFKKTYFADFPVEYMVTLIESTIRQGFPLARTLLQQHLTYQLKEMAWLKEMLSTHHERRIEPEILHSPLKKIHYEIKNGLFNKLIETEKLNKNKSPLEIYFSQEETLDFINSEIIQACLKLSKRELRKQTIDGVVMNYNWAQINLSCALTRVPREAVNFMVETLSLSNIDEVMISLSYNRLRWIPDELFSIKGLEHLNLQNNLLDYVPKNIKDARDHLKTLILGNYEAYRGVRCLSGVTSSRTSGNKFKAIPPAILQLPNLQKLDIKSVGLEECPDDEIYKVLPKLVYVNVAHNKLSLIPKSIFGNRNIEVVSYDNPGHALTSGVKTLHRMDLFWDRLSKTHFNAMAFIGAHPVAFPLGVSIILPVLFAVAFYLEHGSEGLWIIKKI